MSSLSIATPVIACRKIPHTNREAARKHRKFLESLDWNRGDRIRASVLEIYRCKQCGHYHCGHRPKGV